MSCGRHGHCSPGFVGRGGAVVVAGGTRRVSLPSDRVRAVDLLGGGKPLETIAKIVVAGTAQHVGNPGDHSASPGAALDDDARDRGNFGGNVLIAGVLRFRNHRVVPVLAVKPAEAQITDGKPCCSLKELKENPTPGTRQPQWYAPVFLFWNTLSSEYTSKASGEVVVRTEEIVRAAQVALCGVQGMRSFGATRRASG